MQLITRSDFDGLVCAALLVEAGIVDSFNFVHPKDLQDGLIEVTENDVLANVPYVPGCGLWFDHHASEVERLQVLPNVEYEGHSEIRPSCARVIYDYYGGPQLFSRFDENGLMAAVDKSDSGQHERKDIIRPTGWIMLSYIMDPRTGLGYHKNYRISNYALMKDLIHYCRTMDPEEILALPDVQERITRYWAQEKAYEKMIRANSQMEGNVLVIDLLDVDEIRVGNRFKEFALFPEARVSMRIIWGLRREKVVFNCGQSIINRRCPVNIGSLMLKYGGGGHTRVGTCQIEPAEWKKVRYELVAALREVPVLV